MSWSVLLGYFLTFLDAKKKAIAPNKKMTRRTEKKSAELAVASLIVSVGIICKNIVHRFMLYIVKKVPKQRG